MLEPLQSLPLCPLDLVGDVHGELDALDRLLGRLGYGPDGLQRDGEERHLVFLGDLGDRGPDSPGVVRRVRRLVRAGVASCVLGNHELNAMRGFHKQGNGWLMGHEDTYPVRRASGVAYRAFDSEPARGEEAADILTFFRSLPLALERHDLRVVHACWSQGALDQVSSERGLCAQADAFDETVRSQLVADGVLIRAQRQREAWSGLSDPALRPTEALPDVQRVDLARQVGNPIKVLTSGLEAPLPPGNFSFKGGRWRLLRRDPWWERYEEDVPVVIGHYWRGRDAALCDEDTIFRGLDPLSWFGRRSNVFCVDYSVGRRFFERAVDGAPTGRGALAALQWPERRLVFDDQDDGFTTTDFGG